MSGKDYRSERQSLQIATGFDAKEQITIGGGTIDCTSGSFTNRSGSENRNRFYLRSIYNGTTGSLTVHYTEFNDTTDYIAEIPTGTWFHAYSNIETVLGADGLTDSGSVTFGYVLRSKVDATGNL